MAFLDEIFKANSAILNALLSILNERTFYNDGQPVQVPLLACIGASNEYPDGAELGALYDRFLVRYWIEPIHDRDNLRAMLKAAEPGPVAADVRLDLQEIEAARAEVRKVKLSADMLTMLLDVKDAAARTGITCSDRRWRQASRYLRAVAWLAGRDEVIDDDFMSLADCLWREHGERPAVLGTIGKIANPALIACIELYDAARDLFRESARKPNEEGFQWTVRIGRSLQEVEKIVGRMEAIVVQNPGKQTLTDRLASTKATAKALRTEALQQAGL